MGGNRNPKKNRLYEQNRRNRLNEQFEELRRLLPDYDPRVNLSKLEIITQTLAYLKDLLKFVPKYKNKKKKKKNPIHKNAESNKDMETNDEAKYTTPTTPDTPVIVKPKYKVTKRSCNEVTKVKEIACKPICEKSSIENSKLCNDKPVTPANSEKVVEANHAASTKSIQILSKNTITAPVFLSGNNFLPVLIPQNNLVTVLPAVNVNHMPGIILMPPATTKQNILPKSRSESTTQTTYMNRKPILAIRAGKSSSKAGRPKGKNINNKSAKTVGNSPSKTTQVPEEGVEASIVVCQSEAVKPGNESDVQHLPPLQNRQPRTLEMGENFCRNHDSFEQTLVQDATPTPNGAKSCEQPCNFDNFKGKEFNPFVVDRLIFHEESREDSTPTTEPVSAPVTSCSMDIGSKGFREESRIAIATEDDLDDDMRQGYSSLRDCSLDLFSTLGGASVEPSVSPTAAFLLSFPRTFRETFDYPQSVAAPKPKEVAGGGSSGGKSGKQMERIFDPFSLFYPDDSKTKGNKEKSCNKNEFDAAFACSVEDCSKDAHVAFGQNAFSTYDIFSRINEVSQATTSYPTYQADVSAWNSGIHPPTTPVAFPTHFNNNNYRKEGYGSVATAKDSTKMVNWMTSSGQENSHNSHTQQSNDNHNYNAGNVVSNTPFHFHSNSEFLPDASTGQCFEQTAANSKQMLSSGDGVSYCSANFFPGNAVSTVVNGAHSASVNSFVTSHANSNYVWSPTKPLSHLDAHLALPPALPTLVGDLALDKSNTFSTIRKEKHQGHGYSNTDYIKSNAQGTFLSVTRLVDKSSKGSYSSSSIERVPQQSQPQQLQSQQQQQQQQQQRNDCNLKKNSINHHHQHHGSKGGGKENGNKKGSSKSRSTGRTKPTYFPAYNSSYYVNAVGPPLSKQTNYSAESLIASAVRVVHQDDGNESRPAVWYECGDGVQNGDNFTAGKKQDSFFQNYYDPGYQGRNHECQYSGGGDFNQQNYDCHVNRDGKFGQKKRAGDSSSYYGTYYGKQGKSSSRASHHSNNNNNNSGNGVRNGGYKGNGIGSDKCATITSSISNKYSAGNDYSVSSLSLDHSGVGRCRDSVRIYQENAAPASCTYAAMPSIEDDKNGRMNSNNNRHQTNTMHQPVTSLTNFNLSAIFPEINDKCVNQPLIQDSNTRYKLSDSNSMLREKEGNKMNFPVPVNSICSYYDRVPHSNVQNSIYTPSNFQPQHFPDFISSKSYQHR